MHIGKLIYFLGAICIIVYFFVRRKKNARLLLLAALISGLSIDFLPFGFWGTWNAAKELNSKMVTEIVLRPSAPEWEVNLTDADVIIRDRNEIDSLIVLLQNSNIYSPNHPSRVWETEVVFHTSAHDSIAIRIEKLQKGQTIIYSKNGEFSNKYLAKYLENISKFTVPQLAKANHVIKDPQ